MPPRHSLMYREGDTQWATTETESQRVVSACIGNEWDVSANRRTGWLEEEKKLVHILTNAVEYPCSATTSTCRYQLAYNHTDTHSRWFVSYTVKERVKRKGRNHHHRQPILLLLLLILLWADLHVRTFRKYRSMQDFTHLIFSLVLSLWLLCFFFIFSI